MHITSSKDDSTPGVPKLARTVGAFVIMASAVSQEYGAGINVVATQSIGSYPGIGSLVPLAMFITGLLLLPKVFMFQRFGSVASASGGEYVWMSRTIHPRIGFIIHFTYFVGIISAIGFIAYAAGTTLASTLISFGITSGGWFSTFIGHITLGLVLIWLMFGMHYTGVRSYGFFVSILFVLVLLAAIISMAVGFGTSNSAFTTSLSTQVFHGPIPVYAAPGASYQSFFGTMTLFIFAYGGLSAAPLLGGEARNPEKSMPKGIIVAWLIALILFSLVALAIFHVVTASNVFSLLKSKKAYYATVPGIVSLVAPNIVGRALSVIVTIIIAKTIAPQMLAVSRTMFSWSEDGLFPRIFGHTNRLRAPDFSLFIAGLVGSVFLIDTAVVGITVVAIRSVSVLLVIMFLAIGVLFTLRKKEKKDWEKRVTTASMVVAAVAGIIVGLVMIPSVIIVPHVPLLLQPSFQVFLSVVISAIIYEIAKARAKAVRGVNLSAVIQSKLPLE